MSFGGHCRGGDWGGIGQEKETNRSICPSFISCALISDLRSGFAAFAAAAVVGVFGITTPDDVLLGDGCDIFCVERLLPSSASSVCIANPGRFVLFPW